MSRYTFTINGMVFKSKKAVIGYVRTEIHGKYADYEEISGEHLRFMIDLLRYHPWSDQKIGVGVRRMWVQPNDLFPTKGFWLERIDGTKTDFSFYQCVEPASLMRDFKAACRHAIAPWSIAFRREYFNLHGEKVRCPLSGEWMSIYESHVDHEPPNTFEKIVSDFLEETKLDMKTVGFAAHADGNMGCFFADPLIEEQWVRFHNQRASLRVLSIKANLSLAKVESI